MSHTDTVGWKLLLSSSGEFLLALRPPTSDRLFAYFRVPWDCETFENGRGNAISLVVVSTSIGGWDKECFERPKVEICLTGYLGVNGNSRFFSLI